MLPGHILPGSYGLLLFFPFQASTAFFCKAYFLISFARARTHYISRHKPKDKYSLIFSLLVLRILLDYQFN
jgi:hypothetical protein